MGSITRLNIPGGDLTIQLSFDPAQAEDVSNAKQMAEDMQKKGYSIFIKDGDGSLVRVKKFNPELGQYVISTSSGLNVSVPMQDAEATVIPPMAGG